MSKTQNEKGAPFDEPRPYPDHISGTFMDKSQIPQHIRDKMKADRDKAMAAKAENEKAQSVEQELHDTVYSLITDNDLYIVSDGEIYYEATREAVRQVIIGLKEYGYLSESSKRISELEAKVKRYEEAFISIQTLTVCYDLQPFHKHICEIIEDHNKVPKPTEK